MLLRVIHALCANPSKQHGAAGLRFAVHGQPPYESAALFGFWIYSVVPAVSCRNVTKHSICGAITLEVRMHASGVAASSSGSSSNSSLQCTGHGRRWRGGQPIISVHVFAVMVDDEELVERRLAGRKAAIIGS